jgi:hypothetical protein
VFWKTFEGFLQRLNNLQGFVYVLGEKPAGVFQRTFISKSIMRFVHTLAYS